MRVFRIIFGIFFLIIAIRGTVMLSGGHNGIFWPAVVTAAGTAGVLIAAFVPEKKA